MMIFISNIYIISASSDFWNGFASFLKAKVCKASAANFFIQKVRDMTVCKSDPVERKVKLYFENTRMFSPGLA